MKRLEILFEDDDLVIVNKPEGVLSIPGRNTAAKDMYTALKKRYENVFVVHRIDKNTSGIMVFALNEDAHRALNIQFQDRKVKKIYHAILNGVPQVESGVIDRAIAPDNSVAGKMRIHPSGKKAVSKYKVLQSFKRYSLVEFEIETGRTHQVRVHAQSLGHPLLVDEMYGGKKEFFLSEVKGKGFNKGKYEEERPILKRTPLHAFQLEIIHPVSGDVLSYSQVYPKDMRALLNQFKKWMK